MKRNAPLAIAAFVVVLIANSAFAQEAEPSPAQQFVVDTALAKIGKNVWAAKGCMSCHTIGQGNLAAPDLNGVYDRRTVAWVKSLLKDPEALFDSDETAKALLKEWNGFRMPNMKLTDAEIEAVMHYVAQQQKPQK